MWGLPSWNKFPLIPRAVKKDRSKSQYAFDVLRRGNLIERRSNRGNFVISDLSLLSKSRQETAKSTLNEFIHDSNAESRSFTPYQLSENSPYDLIW